MQNLPQPLRIFIALDLSKELRQSVLQLQRHLQYLPGAAAIRWTRAEHFHLTLQFLGNVESDRIDELKSSLQNACAGFAPLKLSLARTGCFPSFRKPSIVWLGAGGDLESLHALQQKCADAVAAFGDHREQKAFSPHLTIGRVKSGAFKTARIFGQALEADSKKMTDLGAWEVQSVELMRSALSSKGAEHMKLASILLK